MKYRILSLLALLLTATYAGADSVALDDRNWQLVTSANFRMHSVLSAERSVEMLRQLETMRAALEDPETPPTYASATPTIIVAVDSHDDYVRLGAPQNTVGFFIAGIRENTIVVFDETGSEGIETMLHEYVHYLNNSRDRVLRPRWFEEGSAEYLSASRIDGDYFEFGLPQQDRLVSLNLMPWIPAEKLLTLTDTSTLGLVEGGQYYGQSWLLYHYLHSQSGAEQRVARQLRRYGELIGAGHKPQAAFSEAFDIEVEDLADVLMDYLQQADFAVQRIPAVSTGSVDRMRFEAIPRSRMQIVLGNTAMHFGRDDIAENWFVAALQDRDLQAYGEAGLARVAAVRGELDAAAEGFEAAIHKVAWDFAIWMDYAQFWALRVSTTPNLQERTRLARRLHEALDAALTIGEPTPEVNSLRGLAYMAQGRQLDDAIKSLQAAATQSPADQPSRYLLANAYLMNGDLLPAIETAQSILAYEHEQNELTEATNALLESARADLRRRQLRN